MVPPLVEIPDSAVANNPTMLFIMFWFIPPT